MKLIVPTADQVIKTNKYICEEQGNPFGVLKKGAVESALHTAFYPGSSPFVNGGVAKIAGALCFYLVNSHAFIDGNKRTGAIVAVTFMNLNGWDLKFANKEKNGNTAFANLIEGCAAGKFDKDYLIDWFDGHKVAI